MSGMFDDLLGYTALGDIWNFKLESVQGGLVSPPFALQLIRQSSSS